MKRSGNERVNILFCRFSRLKEDRQPIARAEVSLSGRGGGAGHYKQLATGAVLNGRFK